ncbi:MAG: hypothetical protein M3Y66_03745, partial [Actinomycetota bacterium]|nr:hypothetical protein [Actinomycetota bacterium]
MAERVFLHIGLPKTATTYLQTVLWGARDQMRAAGVLLPGHQRREHLWASRVVREEATLEHASPRQRGAWDRLRAEIEVWPRTALISHEFFAAASADQARRMIEQLAPAEVHLVLTGREPLGLFTASWQESLKNRETAPMSDYAREVSDSPAVIWNWRTLDLRLVLERWAPQDGPVPSGQVHLLPLPGKNASRDLIWHRYAGLLGLDSQAYDLSGNFPNQSMGVVEAETLRRVNEHLDTFTEAIDRGTYIRTFLADERLLPRGGERYWPGFDQIAECRERGRAALDHIRNRGFHVIGDLEDLRVPENLPERRHPGSVTEAEVAEVAVELVARMLSDVRDLRHERRRLRNQLAARDAAAVV